MRFGHERVDLYLYSPYGPYGLYRASVPVRGCTFVHEVARYTIIHITYNILISGILWYLTTPSPRGTRYNNFYCIQNRTLQVTLSPNSICAKFCIQKIPRF